MEGSEGGRRSHTFFAAAGDIQAKPTRVSGGLDLLVITGETIVWPSDYVLRFVFLFFIQEPFEVFSLTDPHKQYSELFGLTVARKRCPLIFTTSFPV